MVLKMADFKNATNVESHETVKHDVVGMIDQNPPEMLFGHGYTSMIHNYNLGLLMYEMLTGRMPFDSGREAWRTKKMIMYEKVKFEKGDDVSAEARDLVQKLLAKQPHERPFLDTLKTHPFFTRNTIPIVLPPTILKQPLSVQFVQKFIKKKAETGGVERQKTIAKSESTKVLSSPADFLLPQLDKQRTLTRSPDTAVSKVGPQFRFARQSMKQVQLARQEFL